MERPPYAYDELEELIPLISASTTPVAAGAINPLIKQVLQKCPGSIAKKIGGHSVWIVLTTEIVAKIPFRAGDHRCRHEQQIFNLFDLTPCPHLVRIFLCQPNITSMQFLS